MHKFGIYELEFGKDNLPMLVKDGDLHDEAKITAPGDTVKLMLEKPFAMNKRCEERIYIIGLNNSKDVVGVSLISQGTDSASLLTPRLIFARLLLMGAKAFVMVHNHPSGRVDPSSEDVQVTETIKEAGELLDTKLCDHVIIGEDDNYFSFLERSLL